MMRIFRRIFDWFQSAPGEFNVVTGEWSFWKEPAFEEHGPQISKWKKLRLWIAWKLGYLTIEDRPVIDAYWGINKKKEESRKT
jgi:hypothetical protein